MRYTLLLHYSEAGGANLTPEEMAEWMAAFDAYGASLHSAGVLVGADVLQSVTASTTVTVRDGSPKIQPGPFADTTEQLGGIITIDVPDLDAALAWAEKCPAAQWGTIEIRPTALYIGAEGQWHRS